VKYKAIGGAAHNFGESFVSGLNRAGGDQSMSHLVRAAISSGMNEVSVDLLTGQAGPPALVTPPVAEAVALYVRRFPQFLAEHRIEIAHVSAARMIVRFVLEGTARARWFGPSPRVPFECVVAIVDDRGKEHEGRVQDIWPCAPRHRV
jgi:hypothetical protein